MNDQPYKSHEAQDLGLTEAAIYRRLTTIFRQVFGRPIELSSGMSAADVPGWDSFSQVRLLLAVEDQFDVHLHINEVNAMRNIADLVRLIAAQG